MKRLGHSFCLAAAFLSVGLCNPAGQSLDDTALLQQDVTLRSSPAVLEAPEANGALLETGSAVADGAEVEQIVALPSLSTILGVFMAIGLTLSMISLYGWSRGAKGCCCQLSGCCGSIFVLVALAFVAIKVILLVYAGPDPVEPMVPLLAEPPRYSEVETSSPFSATEINTYPSIYESYLEGMRNVVKGTGVKVLGLTAVPGGASGAVLAQLNRSEPVFPVVLRFLLGAGTPPPSPTVQQQLPAKVQEVAATIIVDKRVQQGTRMPPETEHRFVALADGEVEAKLSVVKVKADRMALRFHISADLRITDDIRDTIKSVVRLKKLPIKGGDAPHDANFYANHYFTAVFRNPAHGLKADLGRCNDDSQAQEMKICVTKAKGWVTVTGAEPLNIPENPKEFLCDISHTLKCNMDYYKKEMFVQIEQHAPNSIAVSSNMLGSIQVAVEGAADCGVTNCAKYPIVRLGPTDFEA